LTQLLPKPAHCLRKVGAQVPQAIDRDCDDGPSAVGVTGYDEGVFINRDRGDDVTVVRVDPLTSDDAAERGSVVAPVKAQHATSTGLPAVSTSATSVLAGAGRCGTNHRVSDRAGRERTDVIRLGHRRQVAAAGGAVGDDLLGEALDRGQGSDGVEVDRVAVDGPKVEVLATVGAEARFVDEKDFVGTDGELVCHDDPFV
jgi:hypothetical protein